MGEHAERWTGNAEDLCAHLDMDLFPKRQGFETPVGSGVREREDRARLWCRIVLLQPKRDYWH